MIKTFICTNTECVNVGIEYVLTDPAPVVECGGCKIVLEAQ